MVSMGANIVADLRAEGWWFEVCYRGLLLVKCPVCGKNVWNRDALVVGVIPDNAKGDPDCETLCMECYEAMGGGR